MALQDSETPNQPVLLTSLFRSHRLACMFRYSHVRASTKRLLMHNIYLQMNTFSEPTTYDAEGRVVKSGDLDPEAQQISDEFKHSSYPN
jgi:hypothetical protein